MLDLENLDEKLTKALAAETTESLDEWLNNKREKLSTHFSEEDMDFFYSTLLLDNDEMPELDDIAIEKCRLIAITSIKETSLIEKTYSLREKIINLICASGANITHMEHIVSSKYISKKEMKKALDQQMKLLGSIENLVKEKI